ncbi:MAG: hypothetical protein QXI39_09910 [Candidatus Bathyarchaeia archaeon]
MSKGEGQTTKTTIELSREVWSKVKLEVYEKRIPVSQVLEERLRFSNKIRGHKSRKVTRAAFLGTCIIMGLVAAIVSGWMRPRQIVVMQACWPRAYDNLPALYKDAYAVVIGRVARVYGVLKYEEEQTPYATVYAFKVSLSLKRNVEDYMVEEATILIMQGAWTVDGVTYIAEGDVLIKPREQLVVFVEGPWRGMFGSFGPWGRFVVKDGKVYSLASLRLVEPFYSVKGVDGIPLDDFITKIRLMEES